MNEASEVLERHGVVKDVDSLLLAEFEDKKKLRLHREVYETVLRGQRKDYAASAADPNVIDPFSFLASRSIRGGECGGYLCRMQKLDLLGRYAALYANRVILPLHMSDPSKVKNADQAAHELSEAALALLRLRPLLDAGLVFPVVMISFHCVHTKEWCDTMTSLVHDVADHAANDLQAEFVTKYQLPEKSPTGRSTIYVDGPEDFVDHGSVVQLFDEGPGWKQRSWKYDREGKVEFRGRRKVACLEYLFNAIAEDTTFYLAYGRNCNARYLTTRPGEAFLLDWLTDDDEVSASSAALNAYLAHTLPLLGDLPLTKLLKIRKEEREPFDRYRLAIQQILTEVAGKKKRISKKEVRDLFRDRLEPELASMRAELYQERRRQVRRIVGGIGSVAASIALGAFGGIVPALAKAALVTTGTAVGAGLLGKAAQSTCEHGASVKERNDFYFLLRLTEEGQGK